MEIKDLDKKQYILLTLLITFVVSIATGIVTVSLMNQTPKSVPQTINNVIQRTIEKVTTVPAPVTTTDNKTDTKTESSGDLSALFSSNDEALVSIYASDTKTNTEIPVTNTTENPTPTTVTEPVAIGQGIIISDIGLVLVDSSILTESTLYKIILNKTAFNASVLKKFNNGFTILKISVITNKPADTSKENTDTVNKPQ